MATITLSNFLAKVNDYLKDNLSGTTTSAGDVGATTFVDSSLSKYEDDYFGGGNENVEWWAYIGTELRAINDFTSSTGTVEVYTAFSAQVDASTDYELHRFDRDDKIIACNQALYECYPDFYLQVDDETTLDGLGSSDIDYEVPSDFVDFPDLIYKKHTSNDKITYTQITDYEPKYVGGTWKFYANITEGDDILLIGKKPLSQFTVGTDTSTTELTDIQANTVAYLAASIFCRNMSNVVSADNSGRFDSLANRFRALYDDNANKTRMGRIYPEKVGFDWTRHGKVIHAWRNG